MDAKSGAAILTAQLHDPKSLLNEGSNFEGLSPEKKAERLSQLTELQNITAVVSRAKSECGDINDAVLADGSIYSLALAAATQGNRDAASCYVSTGFAMPDSMRANPVEFQKYRQNASALIDSGIQAGNWMLVGSAIGAYSGRASNDWLYRIAAADPVAVYRYTRLEQLGTRNPETRAVFDNSLREQARQLSPGQIKQGDVWAEKTFRQFFRNSGYYDDARVRCG